MPTAGRVLLLVLVVLAACDDAPTRPEAQTLSLSGTYLATRYESLQQGQSADLLQYGYAFRLDLAADGSATLEVLTPSELQRVEGDWLLEGGAVAVRLDYEVLGFDTLTFEVSRHGDLSAASEEGTVAWFVTFERREGLPSLSRRLPAELVILSLPRSDTIEATLQERAYVQVLDSTGAPVPNRAVLLTATEVIDARGYAHASVAVGQDLEFLGGSGWATTDSLGIASIVVRLGRTAGPAGFAIRAADVVDSVTLVIATGAASDLVALPLDTALAIGRTYIPRAAVVDRHGNVRDDAVTLSSEDSDISTDGLRITGLTTGRARAILTGGGIDTSIQLTIVPHGRLVGVRVGNGDQHIITFEVDGSDVDTLVTHGTIADHYAPAPSPIDDRVVYQRGLSIVDGGSHDDWHRLMVVSPGVAPRPFMADSLPDASGPHWATQTNELFFGTYAWPHGRVWTVDANGSAADTISVPGDIEMLPVPAPDGSRFAYLEYSYALGPMALRVFDRATGTASAWGLSGTTPRWSPDGTRFAYIRHPDGALLLADGTTGESAVLSAAFTFSEGHLTWSPDGEWLIAHVRGDGSLGVLYLIRLDDGALLPLPYSGPISQVSWDQ